MENSDNVKKPKHYNSHPGGYECWDVVGPFGYFIGNAMKYLWRCGLKDGANEIEDLKKAIAFIEKEIKNRELLTAKVDTLTIVGGPIKIVSNLRAFRCKNCGDTGKIMIGDDSSQFRYIPCPSCQPPEPTAQTLHPA